MVLGSVCLPHNRVTGGYRLGYRGLWKGADAVTGGYGVALTRLPTVIGIADSVTGGYRRALTRLPTVIGIADSVTGGYSN